MKRTNKIIISPLARIDLEQIWFYTFNTWSFDQANKYQDILFEGFTQIAEEKAIFQSIDDIKKEFKMYNVNHHYIIYTQTKSKINIVRILHERMDILNRLDKL